MITDRAVDAIRREYTHRYNKYIEVLQEEEVLRDLVIARQKIEELEEQVSALQDIIDSHQSL